MQNDAFNWKKLTLSFICTDLVKIYEKKNQQETTLYVSTSQEKKKSVREFSTQKVALVDVYYGLIVDIDRKSYRKRGQRENEAIRLIDT